MSTELEHYVLDANVFIQAKRKFYGLDFCTGSGRRGGHMSKACPAFVHEVLMTKIIANFTLKPLTGCT